MTVFYKKVGRKYEPVSEYDNELMSAFPRGAHLVVTVPGGRSTRYNIDPALGPMIAAGKYAEDAVSQAIYKATDLRLSTRTTENRKLTPGQKVAWDNLVKEFGDSAKQLEWPSAREAAEAGVEAMITAAQDLMLDPKVQAAWDHFLLLAKLAKENKNGS
jgi:hypothetical protein